MDKESFLSACMALALSISHTSSIRCVHSLLLGLSVDFHWHGIKDTATARKRSDRAGLGDGCGLLSILRRHHSGVEGTGFPGMWGRMQLTSYTDYSSQCCFPPLLFFFFLSRYIQPNIGLHCYNYMLQLLQPLYLYTGQMDFPCCRKILYIANKRKKAKWNVK